MSTEQPGLRFEIGHVLFINIVGYSKLLITEQSELLRKLTAVVRETGRIADAEGKLIHLPVCQRPKAVWSLHASQNSRAGWRGNCVA